MEIIQSPSPNFSSRHGYSPIAIVDHITAGAYPGCLTWLQNPAAQASAHFIINKAGRTDQLVDLQYAAWHAGIVKNPNWGLYNGKNPNWYTVGIEHECISGGELTELQYQATLALHKYLINLFPAITPDTDHIIGHYRINPVQRPNCPGPNFPWQRLFADLTQQGVNIAIGDKIVQGIIVGDRSYTPIRAIAQILGFTYGWQPNPPAVIIGATTVPVVIQGETGYAKVNELAAAIGRQVVWDGPTNTVRII